MRKSVAAKSTNYLIGNSYETMPAEYLTHNKTTYTLLDNKTLQDLPLATSSQLYVMSADSSAQQRIEILQAKYPNGQLTPHYSSFNDQLLFYTFQVN